MKRIVGVGLSLLVACASVAAFVVAVQAKSTARDTLEQAQRLYEARLGVARAQEDLGASNLEAAIASARKANTAAQSVKAITTRIARLLGEAEVAAEATSKTSRAAVRNVTLTRRQTVATGAVLAAISGYQQAASTFAGDTNAALLRILDAVRKTNRSFPGAG